MDVFKHWDDTPKSIIASNAERFKGFHLRAIDAPWYYTTTSTSINVSNMEKFKRFFPDVRICSLVSHIHVHVSQTWLKKLQQIPITTEDSPWYGTPMSVNESNVETKYKGIPLLGLQLPFGPTCPRPSMHQI